MSRIGGEAVQRVDWSGKKAAVETLGKASLFIHLTWLFPENTLFNMRQPFLCVLPTAESDEHGN